MSDEVNFWLFVFAALIISIILMLIERNRLAIVVVILLAVCYAMFKYGGKIWQTKTTKRN